jgi:hypothetical protein
LHSVLKVLIFLLGFLNALHFWFETILDFLLVSLAPLQILLELSVLFGVDKNTLLPGNFVFILDKGLDVLVDRALNVELL